VCFGSHVDVDTLKSAKYAGADRVISRSGFFRALSKLIQEYAKIPDYDSLLDACHTTLSELAIKGLEMFNQKVYFEAHEYLEDAWNEDQTSGRELYRAILQIAVAYLQIERKNYNGAAKMFLRVRQWIDPLPDLCRGVDVAGLRKDAKHVHETLLNLGEKGIADFDLSLLKPVHYHE
jgi:hypothetical protein